MTKEELIYKINDLEWEDFEAKEAITFLNDKLGESWEKVGRKPIIPSISSIFFTQDYWS